VGRRVIKTKRPRPARPRRPDHPQLTKPKPPQGAPKQRKPAWRCGLASRLRN